MSNFFTTNCPLVGTLLYLRLEILIWSIFKLKFNSLIKKTSYCCCKKCKIIVFISLFGAVKMYNFCSFYAKMFLNICRISSLDVFALFQCCRRPSSLASGQTCHRALKCSVTDDFRSHLSSKKRIEIRVHLSVSVCVYIYVKCECVCVCMFEWVYVCVLKLGKSFWVCSCCCCISSKKALRLNILSPASRPHTHTHSLFLPTLLVLLFPISNPDFCFICNGWTSSWSNKIENIWTNLLQYWYANMLSHADENVTLWNICVTFFSWCVTRARRHRVTSFPDSGLSQQNEIIKVSRRQEYEDEDDMNYCMRH